MSFLRNISIYELKWEMIAMYFVIGRPIILDKFNSICDVVDKLTKSSHFIAIRVEYNS